MIDTPRDDEWCIVAEAARRLRVTPAAIRHRIKRRTLEVRPNGNVGHLVRVPRPVPGTDVETLPSTMPETVSVSDLNRRTARPDRRASSPACVGRCREGEPAARDGPSARRQPKSAWQRMKRQRRRWPRLTPCWKRCAGTATAGTQLPQSGADGGHFADVLDGAIRPRCRMHDGAK